MEKLNFKLFIKREAIQEAVQRLAQKINKDYQGKEIIAVIVLRGAYCFAADLLRHLDLPVEIDFVRLSSYGKGLESSGKVKLHRDIVKAEVQDKHALIIEEIVDTGKTVAFLKERLKLAQPKSVKICTLLNKKARREVEVKPDYIGIEVENKFLVGYGLDFQEKYRHLPDIYFVEGK